MAGSSETPIDANWSPAEREAYERECLEDTRRRLVLLTAADHDPHELRSIRLEGRYPETRIVLELWDGRYGEAAHYSYSVWSASNFLSDRGREPPDQVGLLMSTWALGG